MDTTRFDDGLAAMASQLGGIEPLLQAFFSFLHRRTDFYVAWDPKKLDAPPKMGFPIGKAEELVLKTFRSFPYEAYKGAPASTSQAPPAPREPRTKPLATELQKNQPLVQAAQVLPPQLTPPAEKHEQVAVGESEGEKLSSSRRELETLHIKYTEVGKQVPIGNGGICAEQGYYWTQSLQEVTACIDVPVGTKGKAIICNIMPKSIVVALKGADGERKTLLSGNLPYAIKPEESIWNLDSAAGSVILSLDKGVKTWWACLIEGGPQIDTSLVDSTCKVQDYDEATQATIRKIMFDQNQKMKGLPTSDEMTNAALFEKAKFAPGSPFLPGGPMENSDVM